MSDDVPNPIDFRDFHVAREWERDAPVKRPSRPAFFREYAVQMREHTRPVTSVLELGSGPGFLAQHLLVTCPHLDYTALDFSAAMHQLARARLGESADRVRFVERNFREKAWTDGLGSFDCVVTHQAVHELRHKRYATGLHKQVSAVLHPGGLYLVCDHFAGRRGMANEQLYMTPQEQKLSLIDAGFESPELVKCADKLAMYRAVC